MGLYSVFDGVFAMAKVVIHETGRSVDVDRKALCCKGGYGMFLLLLHRGGYIHMSEVISELLRFACHHV